MDANTISYEQFAKLHFCREYWDKTGGDPKHRPYWDEIGNEHIGIQQRVYISALWFDTWEKFAPEASRALMAAVVKYDYASNSFVKSGSSYHITEKPHYLIERLTKWSRSDDIFAPWINALCPSKEQFDITLAEARRKIEEMKQGITPGFRVQSLFEPKPAAPLYPTEWCQDKDGDTVGELLRRKGIRR